MKKLLQTLFILLMMTPMWAQQPTVSLHNSGQITIYQGSNAFSTAHTAATHGDTLFLSGGVFPASFINKKLVVIGVGFHPDSTASTQATIIDGNFSVSTAADSSHIEGLHISGDLRYGQNIHHVTIKRCLIQVNVQTSLSSPSQVNTNWHFIQNVFYGDVNIHMIRGSIMANNVLKNRVVNSIDNMFRNNVFLKENTGTYEKVLYSSNQNTFYNNIFANNSDATYHWSSSYNYFVNNIFHFAEPILSNHVHSAPNYYGVDVVDVFVQYESRGEFAFTDDYRFKAGMADTYPGDDETEVGIYGGFYPVKVGWLPITPHFSTLEVGSTSNEDGELPVTFTISAQEN